MCIANKILIAPAEPAIEYQDRRFQGAFLDENPFKGAPQPELDAAWDSLLNGTIIVFKLYVHWLANVAKTRNSGSVRKRCDFFESH